MSKIKILVVEDEVVIAMDLQQRLIRLGYDVPVIVGNGEEAIDTVVKLRPSLVMMDIRLQGEMDGIQAAQRIRREARIPVIFLTAHSDDTTLQRAKMAEPFSYIVKPFNERELKASIEMALHRHSLEEDRAQILASAISELVKTKS
jgi:CheY-like chemotaxis protein